MATVIESDERLKEVFKTAIIEVLQERRDLVREILDEIIEDIAFSKAIAEGRKLPASAAIQYSRYRRTLIEDPGLTKASSKTSTFIDFSRDLRGPSK